MSSEWLDTGKFDLHIVGEFAYEDAIDLMEEKGKDVFNATLVYENDNSHDSQAVAVRISNRKVGYLSRNDAIRFRNKVIESGLSGDRFKTRAKLLDDYDHNSNRQIVLSVKLSAAHDDVSSQHQAQAVSNAKKGISFLGLLLLGVISLFILLVIFG